MNAENGSSVRAQIVALARELGFDLCRFAKADAPGHALEFREWLDRGQGGEMTYLARNAEKRCDPKRVLPKAKTVIVLALNYFQGQITSPVKAGVPPARMLSAVDTAVTTASGRIARYAWGDDYHQLIEKKLSVLDDFLRRNAKVLCR